MTHIRTQIRDSLATLLAAGVTKVNGRVGKSRVRAHWPEGLPALAVYTRSDAVETAADGPMLLRRTLTLTVEVVAKADANLDTVLDNICEQVETVVFANQLMLGGKVELTLGDTEIALTDQGEMEHGSAIITVEAVYFQNAPEDLSGALDPLDQVNAKWNPGGDLPPADQLEDNVTGLAE